MDCEQEIEHPIPIRARQDRPEHTLPYWGMGMGAGAYRCGQAERRLTKF